MKVGIKPFVKGDLGIICMPLVANVPVPRLKSWIKVTCPKCKAECWESEGIREVLKTESGLKPMCSLCAIKEGAKNDND